MTSVAICKCEGCAGLRQRYQKDPTLLQFYAKKLLQRGWAGKTDDVEKAYMASHAEWYQVIQENGRRVAAERPLAGPEPQRQPASGTKADLEKRPPCYDDGCMVALNGGLVGMLPSVQHWIQLGGHWPCGSCSPTGPTFSP
jgi:hypothetical protein